MYDFVSLRHDVLHQSAMVRWQHTFPTGFLSSFTSDGSSIDVTWR